MNQLFKELWINSTMDWTGLGKGGYEKARRAKFVQCLISDGWREMSPSLSIMDPLALHPLSVSLCEAHNSSLLN